MGGVAEQRNAAMAPVRQRVAVAHRIFPADRGRPHQSVDIDSGNFEAPGVGNHFVHPSDPRPGIDGRRRDLAIRDARNDRPVGEARLRRRAWRDRVERDFRAHAAGDVHRPASQELRPFRGAAPEHQPLPTRAPLFRIEVATHDGMDAVRADEHVAAHGLAHQPEPGVREMGDDAAFVLDEALQLQAGAYRAGAKFGDHLVVDHFLQPAAMDRELRKVEAGVRAALFAPHLLTKPADIVQFPGADAHGVELRHEVERREFLDGVRQNVDADPELPDLGRLFENDKVNAAPMKHERQRQSADASARDERLHGSAPFPALTSPLQAAAGNRLRVWPRAPRLRPASARACCGSPRRDRRAGVSATPRTCISQCAPTC